MLTSGLMSSNTADVVILLVPARAETRWFRPLFAYPITFLSGRIRFVGASARSQGAPFPSAIVSIRKHHTLEQLSRLADAFKGEGTLMVGWRS